MRAFLTVFRVTLAGKAGLVLVAFAAGLIPVAVVIARPEIFGYGPLVHTALGTGILAVSFVVGLSLLGDELAGGRLSFYFGRPVPALAVWGGKVAAGAVVVLVIAVLAYAPMAAWWPRSDQGPVLDRLTPATLAIHVISMAIGMIAGVLMRGRSRWSILDLAVLAAIPFVWVDTYAPIEAATARIAAIRDHATRMRLRELLDPRIDAVVAAVLLGVLVACLAASAVALSVGRASPRRAHAAASLTLWSIALPVGAGVMVYAHWFLTA